MMLGMNSKERLAQYALIRLAADPGALSDRERDLLPLLIEAARATDDAFWIQNYGDRNELLSAVSDLDLTRLIEFNYGPWDRLRNYEPFVAGAGARPPGANFYPRDVTGEEFEASVDGNPALKSPYTMVRRDRQGNLVAFPYHIFFRDQMQRAASRLRQAAALAENSALSTFLSLRAEALLTDDYRASDFAWMDMKTTALNILIGPMEVADRLFGLKTAYAASILVRERDRSKALRHYTTLLPRMQRALPVPAAYRQERPGLEGDLAVYDVLYYGGYDRFSPPLGVAWPADEEVQLRRGTRSLLLRNAMAAHFDRILAPLANLLIADDQRQHVTPEANFNVIMLHEMAHGLGIKQTICGKGPVREALKDLGHAVEENKAELLSLVMMDQLYRWGEMSADDVRDGYVTALARLLYNSDGARSIACLNFFKEAGAYSRDNATGKYRLIPERVRAAANALAEKMLRFQGDGDYEGAKGFFELSGRPDEGLQHDMERLDGASIPVALTVGQQWPDPGD